MKNKNGTAIITVLGLITLICIVSGYIAYTASQEMHMSRVLRECLKSKMIAESGLNKAYSIIKTNFTLANGLNIQESFGNGIYKVTSTPDETNPNRFKLISLGTYGEFGKYKVSADVENRQRYTSQNPQDPFFNLTFDLLGLGDISISGNFGADVNSIHGNGNIRVNGAIALDTLTITSGGTVTLRRDIPGVTIQSGVPIVPNPPNLYTAINELITFAIQNGEVYQNGERPSANPIGGIAVCLGTPPANWTGGTGCYIFLGGGRTVFNGITINNVNGYPSLVFLNASEVCLTGNVTLNGAVLLPASSLSFNGNSAVYGPLVVGATISGNGTANLYSGTFGQGFNRPPLVSDNVVISAWH